MTMTFPIFVGRTNLNFPFRFFLSLRRMASKGLEGNFFFKRMGRSAARSSLSILILSCSFHNPSSLAMNPAALIPMEIASPCL